MPGVLRARARPRPRGGVASAPPARPSPRAGPSPPPLTTSAPQQHRRYADPEYVRNLARVHGVNVNRELAECFQVYRIVA